MMDLLHEMVFEATPRSKAVIAAAASGWRKEHAPMDFQVGGPLDLRSLVDGPLERAARIFVCPVADEEMGDCYGLTQLGQDGEVEILIQETIFNNLGDDSSAGRFAQSTMAHELGHAILHVPELHTANRIQRVLGDEVAALRRSRRKDLVAYKDPEWQAWHCAGCLCMPAELLHQMPVVADAADVADAFNVNEVFARAHLDRIRWRGRRWKN